MTVISATRAGHCSMTGERAADPRSPGLSPPCPHAPQLRQLLDHSRRLRRAWRPGASATAWETRSRAPTPGHPT